MAELTETRSNYCNRMNIEMETLNGGQNQRVLMAAAVKRVNQGGKIVPMEPLQKQPFSRPAQWRKVKMDPENERVLTRHRCRG